MFEWLPSQKKLVASAGLLCGAFIAWLKHWAYCVAAAAGFCLGVWLDF